MSLALSLHTNASQCLARRMHANLAAIEHLNASDIEMLAGACADNLRET